MTKLCVDAVMVELRSRIREMGNEDEHDMEDANGYVKSGVQPS
jgi:hypothetical protein